MPKLIYICHPIKGNIKKNFDIVLSICNDIHSEEIIPIIPYISYMAYANPDFSEDGEDRIRELGMHTNKQYFEKKIIDEMWLFGPRISDGMKNEVLLCLKNNIRMKCCNPELKPALLKIIDNYKISEDVELAKFK